MILTITLAIMTTDNDTSIYQKITYIWCLFGMNIAFYIFWICYYIKILVKSLREKKFFRMIFDINQMMISIGSKGRKSMAKIFSIRRSKVNKKRESLTKQVKILQPTPFTFKNIPK